MDTYVPVNIATYANGAELARSWRKSSLEEYEKHAQRYSSSGCPTGVHTKRRQMESFATCEAKAAELRLEKPAYVKEIYCAKYFSISRADAHQ